MRREPRRRAEYRRRPSHASRALARFGAVERERFVSVPITDEPQQRRPITTHPQLPPHPRRRLAPRPHPPLMNPVQVMPRAQRDAIGARAGAAARAEDHVMILEIPP